MCAGAPYEFLRRLCAPVSGGNELFRKEKRLRQAFGAVKEELDEHLDAINSNTEETLENRAMLLELSERLCKVQDALAGFQMRLEDPAFGRFSRISLSLREQEVFLLLYTAAGPIGYAELSRRLSLPSSHVQDLVFALIQKGVPVIKQRSPEGRFLLLLDIEFHELQARHNIVGIDDNLSKQLSRDMQLSLFEQQQ